MRQNALLARKDRFCTEVPVESQHFVVCTQKNAKWREGKIKYLTIKRIIWSVKPR
jgi:hypothetical protein